MVSPLAETFGLPIDESYGVATEKDLAAKVRSLVTGGDLDDGLAVIAWKHEQIPQLAYDLGWHDKSKERTTWRADDYDTIFELTYTRLHKATDARTRVSSAQGTTITLREDGKGGRSCTVISGGGLVGGVAAAIGLGKPCDADELGLLPPPLAAGPLAVTASTRLFARVLPATAPRGRGACKKFRAIVATESRL